jgi:hypothetical protein
MTHRERFRAVLQNEVPDRLPFAPRLALWYKALDTQGLLPPKYAGKTLEQIREMLDCGHPGREASGSLDPKIYKRTFDVETVETMVDGQPNRRRRTYITPYGEVSELFHIDVEAKAKGYHLADERLEFIIKDGKDFKAAEYILDRAKYTPCYEAFTAYGDKMGEAGLPYCSTERDPFYQLMEHFIGLSHIWYVWNDYKEEVDHLYNVIWEREKSDMLPVLTASPAPYITHGRHYDSMMTPPPIFERYMKPVIKELSGALHSAGKLYCMHADADSKLLLELYIESGIDILECYCCYPMVSCTMEETLQRVGDKMVIWGGIPSTLLTPASFKQEDFRDYIDNFFKVLERYKGKFRLIVGMGDLVVPDADMERVEIIAERCANFKFW